MVEKVKATKRAWGVEAEAALVVSMGQDADILAEQVKAGIAECWHFEQAQNVELWAIVRREKNELVVCCLEGIGARRVVPLIEQAAKNAGCDAVRAHTKRPALARMFKDYRIKEYVYKKAL